MKVVLIRHFATIGNLESCYIGKTDQSIRAGSYDSNYDDLQNVSVIFTSLMKRAKETADVLFPNSQKFVAQNLKEMDFGIFEGKSFKDLKNDVDYQNWLDSNCLNMCPGGESKKMFSIRTCEAFCRVINYCIDNEMETVVIVAHGGTAMAIAENIVEPKREYFSVKLGFGKSIELFINPKTFRENMSAEIISNVRKK